MGKGCSGVLGSLSEGGSCVGFQSKCTVDHSIGKAGHSEPSVGNQDV